MSDTVISLNKKIYPIPIKYKNNSHGFSDFNNLTQYIFSLIINGKQIYRVSKRWIVNLYTCP